MPGRLRGEGTNPSPVLSFNCRRRTVVKPLIYGYVRLHGGEPDADVRQMELDLKDYAETEGYCFATIFRDDDSGTCAAFDELIAELKRAEARHVVVPSLAHLSSHPVLLNQMIQRLEQEADAQVFDLGGR